MSNEALRLREIINKIKDHNLLKDRSCKNIRETIEDLGPTFIKMGQILSARDDLVSKELSDELKRLRCSVKPMDYDEVLDILNAEYNGNYQEIFAEIEEIPLGSASIAQTHRAKLKTGEDVVLKIQRKNIYQMMMMDTRLLKKAISILQLDKVVGNIVDLKEIVDEVYSSAKEEMNFMVEAEHIEEFENYNKNVMYIRPLKVYKKYSTPYILVMECVGGCFINEKSKLDRLGYNMNEIALKLADNYIKQAIDDGFFHADPHADNIKIIDGKIAYLDFGMMGRLSSKNKNLLNKCIVAIIKNDIVEVAHILSLLNVNDSNIDYMKLKMYAGRNLTKQDNKTKKNVCIVADTMAKQYFGDENPIGEQITYAGSDGNLYNFTIVGIYEYNAALFGKVDTSVPEKDRSTTMFIPIQTCFKLMGKDQSGYTNFNLMVNSLADIDQATTDVTNFFEEKYANNENFHVTTYNMASDMGMINTVINVITIAVSGIALISLIVGGVGVMNIMLVSITERTREIGVRMALGAKRSTIRMQFVIEAIVLCIFGGMIGILIGVLNGFVLGKAAEFVIQNMYSEYSSYIIMSVRPSLSAIVLSLFFSMLTGVFFGYYPANKAAKMEVIDALRYE